MCLVHICGACVWYARVRHLRSLACVQDMTFAHVKIKGKDKNSSLLPSCHRMLLLRTRK